MKSTSLSGVTAVMALVAGGQTLAEGPGPQDMLALIEFITQNSTLDYAGQDLPDVAVMSENELQLLFRSAEGGILAHEDDRPFARVSAFYDRSANRIFLADVSAIAGAGLFHELVHFLQHINGKDAPSTAWRACLEAEAYELQSIWQTEQGTDLASRPDYGFVMTLYGVCNDSDFSWIETGYQR